MRRRVFLVAAVTAALLLLTWGWLSVDRCGTWDAAPPALQSLGRAAGGLRVGAAAVEISPKYPATVAGYGPPRPTATSAAAPLFARATVLEVGGQPLALVVVDTLLVTQALRAAVQADAGMPVWLVATHTHSSLGGLDQRLAAELAALGSWDGEQVEAVVKAARTAVAEAKGRLAPARLEIASGESLGLSAPRSGGEVDAALTRVRFLAEGGAIAQWVVLSAHPALVPPGTTALDPDWPGRLAALEAAGGGPVTLVLQGGSGNASVDRATATTPDAFARAVHERLSTLTAATPQDSTELAWAEVVLGLSRPDASRLAPAPFRAAVENVLCEDADRLVTVAALRLGPLTLLFTPAEPSAPAARVLIEQAGASRVVSLANGYAGYVEPEEVTRTGGGESNKQYFDAGFLTRLADAARLVGQAVAAAR
ncbi:MAG: neutral/alkaline non-lysosomal ceramidase N-terminal domain-containing protein [Myxococcota bacterium]